VSEKKIYILEYIFLKYISLNIMVLGIYLTGLVCYEKHWDRGSTIIVIKVITLYNSYIYVTLFKYQFVLRVTFAGKFLRNNN